MKELNHIQASNQELLDAAVELSEHRAQTWLSDERKEQISKQLAYIFFEIHCREGAVLLEQPSDRADARVSQ